MLSSHTLSPFWSSETEDGGLAVMMGDEKIGTISGDGETSLSWRVPEALKPRLAAVMMSARTILSHADAGLGAAHERLDEAVRDLLTLRTGAEPSRLRYDQAVRLAMALPSLDPHIRVLLSENRHEVVMTDPHDVLTDKLWSTSEDAEGMAIHENGRIEASLAESLLASVSSTLAQKASESIALGMSFPAMSVTEDQILSMIMSAYGAGNQLSSGHESVDLFLVHIGEPGLLGLFLNGIRLADVRPIADSHGLSVLTERVHGDLTPESVLKIVSNVFFSPPQPRVLVSDADYFMTLSDHLDAFEDTVFSGIREINTPDDED